ncbi:MAG: phospholipase D-like domain-containing protein, partial [Candidatus Nanopelagicales bacterium]
KVLIADGATEKGSVLLCDFNLGPGYFGLDPAYPDQGETRGMAVLDTDPVDVSMIQRTFDADWPPYEPWPANDTAHLDWTPSDPTCDTPTCQMPGAPLEPTTSLDVYVQAFAYPSELLQALVNACASGVKVRVVGNEGGINDEVLRSLGKCGAQVRWNTTDPSGDGRVMYIHTKTIVADAGLPTGVAYVGSVNPFLDESVQTERELGILITDPASVDRIDTVFNRDFEAGTSAL